MTVMHRELCSQLQVKFETKVLVAVTNMDQAPAVRGNLHTEC